MHVYYTYKKLKLSVAKGHLTETQTEPGGIRSSRLAKTALQLALELQRYIDISIRIDL